MLISTLALSYKEGKPAGQPSQGRKKITPAETEAIFPELDKHILEVVLALISALEFREPHTAGHAARVTLLSVRMDKELGFNPGRITILKYAGLLHDIGKIGIDAHILNKKGPLDEKEYGEVKRHPVIAKTILNPIRGLRYVLPKIYHHHEKWDGTGYPDGLKGKAIPLESRIIGVADTYDAITSKRAYRRRRSANTAIRILEEEREKQFESDMVDCFLEILKNDRSRKA